MPKKVAIFINSLRGGGAERVVSYLLKEGCDDFEFHLILLQNEIEYEIPWPEKMTIFELEGAGYSKFKSVLKTPTLARKLKKYLEKNNIETLLTLLVRPNLIACKAKKMGWNGKLIISERVDPIAYYKTIRFGWYMIGLIKNNYPQADTVTVISKGIGRSLAKLGIPHCEVIYNPIPAASVRKPVITERPFTFINIGRLEPQKNQALLIKAFAKIADKNSQLVFLGKGVLMENLKNLAAKLGVADRVHFEGFQQDIISYLLRSDCFVFSSDYEGFGNVVTEAMQAGLPVISTDCPYGPREILSPGTDTDTSIKEGFELAPYGILTPVGHDDYLADAMQKMMEDEGLRNKYKKAGASRSLDFDIQKITKKYFDLF